MADPIIKVTLGSLVVNYTGYRFEDGEKPRSLNPGHAPLVRRSINGSTALSGRNHVPGYLWTIAAANLTENGDLGQQTWELYSHFESERRAGNDPKLLVEDTTEYFFEDGPRTRALATGASEIATTTGIKYYAQYYALFSDQPPVFNIGEGFVVQFEESGEVVAP